MFVFTTVVRLVLFLFSSLGTWELLRRKSGVSLPFLPALTVCTQICVLFAAGLLNCLLPAALILLLGGALAGAVFLVREKGEFLRRYATLGSLYLGLGLVCALVFLWGQQFFDYDNFSHWAIVVKTMMRNDRVPNFTDAVISFQEYPLGSSFFVYYFSRAVGEAEFIQMLSNTYMQLCMLLPLFKFIKKHRAALFALMLLFTNFFFCYDIVIEDLLVDTLMPLVGGAMLLFVLTECFSEEKGVDILWSVPFSVSVVQIKNPGVFYAAFACIAILVRLLRRREAPVRSLAAAAAPPLSFYLWHRHCRLVFAAAEGSRHAMTTNMLLYTFREKGSEEISETLRLCLAGSVKGEHLWGTLGFIVILGLGVLLLNEKRRRKYLSLLIVFGVSYVLYMIGLTLMYLFSMPNVAGSLGAFDRYRCSFFIFALYFFAGFALACASELERKRALAFMLSGFVALGFVWGVDGFPWVFHRYSGIERIPLQSAVDSAGIPEDASSLVLIPEYDGDYTTYLAAYILYPGRAQVRIGSEPGCLDNIEDFDYLIVTDEALRDELGLSSAVTATSNFSK